MSEHSKFTSSPGEPPRDARPREHVLRPLSVAASFAVFLYLGWMMLAGLFEPRGEWFAGGGWGSPLLVYYACLDAFALALSAGFLCGLEGQSFRLLGLSIFSGWTRQSALGLGWGAGVISAAVVVLMITRTADVTVFASPSLSRMLFLACFMALSSMFEELTFRGYVLMRAADSVGPIGACLGTSALFGLAHYANPQATVLSSLNTALAGVLLGIARLRSRALWMPIGLHFAWNFSLGPILSFPVSGYTFGAVRLSVPTGGPVWLSGGAYGPEGSVALTLSLAVAIPLLLRYPVRFPPLPYAPNQS